ncbi:hypothetical protein OIE71_00080 [Streptomyces sp. NBC_01725]|uniref:hypothetical protein n=1 Tax=Streptomyces sp. NBC_01725 TaxID=2975923 RepID=UPI002E28F07A|nr:hypothetical protein [Streptomyces sp. NBC_01725]
MVSERARAKLNGIAAKTTRPPKPKPKGRPLAQLREDWRTSARVPCRPGHLVDSLLERARAAAAAIRARVAAVVDAALAAVDVAAVVFVMNSGGRFHPRHLLAEARRHLALVLRGRSREPDLDDRIVAATAAHCLDISEPKTGRGHEPGYRLHRPICPARLVIHPPPSALRAGPDRPPPTDPGAPAAPPPGPGPGGVGDTPRPAAVRPCGRRRCGGAREAAHHRRAWAYDVARHQQAPTPEELLAPAAAEPEHDDQGPEAGRGEAVDLTALRDLRKSRNDVEALDFTAERLRRIRDAAASAVAGFRARADIRLVAELEGGRDHFPVPAADEQQRASHRQQPGSGRDHGIPR